MNEEVQSELTLSSKSKRSSRKYKKQKVSQRKRTSQKKKPQSQCLEQSQSKGLEPVLEEKLEDQINCIVGEIKSQVDYLNQDKNIEKFEALLHQLKQLKSEGGNSGKQQKSKNKKLSKEKQEQSQTAMQEELPEIKVTPPTEEIKNSQQSLKQYFLTATIKKSNKPEKNNNSIFTSLVPYEFKEFEKTLMNCDQSITLNTIISQIVPVTRKAGSQKKKHYYIFDSMKELNRYINPNQKLRLNPRAPFKKNASVINYDQDSEEEVQDLLADDLQNQENSSDSESNYTEDDDFLIMDSQINQDLLQEYNMKTNFNQQLAQQLQNPEFKAYMFVKKESNTPELLDFFNKYEASLLDGQLSFPLALKKPEQIGSDKKQRVFLQEEANLIEFLLFVHGRKQSKRNIESAFRILHPSCSKNSISKELKKNFELNSDQKYVIKTPLIEFYQIGEKANSIYQQRQGTNLDSTDESPATPQFNSQKVNLIPMEDVLKKGSNLFNQQFFDPNKSSVFQSKKIFPIATDNIKLNNNKNPAPLKNQY